MLTVLGKLWDLLDRRSRRQFGLLTLAILVSGGLEALGVGMVLPVLQIAVEPDSLQDLPWLTEALPRLGPLAEGPRLLMVVALATVVLFVVKNATAFVITRLNYRFIEARRTDLAGALFRGYLRSPYAFHLHRPASTLFRNVIQSSAEISRGIIQPLLLMGADAVVVIAITAALLVMAPLPTLAAMAVLASAAVLFHRVVRRPLSRYGEVSRRSYTDLVRIATEGLHGVKAIKVLGCEPVFESRFRDAVSDNGHVRAAQQTISIVPRLVLEVVTVAGVMAALVATVWSGEPVAQAMPMLGMFGVAALRVMPSVSRMVANLGSLRFTQEWLDEVHADILGFRGQATVGAGEARTPLVFHRDIAIESLSYRYPATEADVLRGIDLVIRRGEVVALVGSSGAGKTTLADIVLGLLDPTTGAVRVDGVAIAGDSGRDWQRRVGYVPQDVFLVAGSIRDNITLGVTRADEHALARVLAMADLESLIAELPEGLETPVGEHGLRLSGGQRQRIGIARALFRDPDVLVLDEATSALDADTEARITRAIDALRGSRTLLVVAHRLSTIRHADRIVFLKEGRVDAIGSFAELATRHPDFMSMVRRMDLSPDVVS